jgi:hypothetical protein
MQRKLTKDIENLRRGIEWAGQKSRFDLLSSWLSILGGKLFEGGHVRDFEHLMDLLDGNITDDRALATFCSYRGALLRRRGDEDAAGLYWDRWLWLAEKIKDEDCYVDALVNNITQRLDMLDAEGSTLFMAKFDEISALEGLEIYRNLFRARLNVVTGNLDDAKIYAWKLHDLLRGSEKQNQVNYYYLIRVYLCVGEIEECLELTRRMLELACAEPNPFHMARLCDIAAPLLEEFQYLEAAYYAYRSAEREHFKIGSRFAVSSRKTRDEFQMRHEIAPEWGQVTEDAMWNTVLSALAALSVQ